MPITIEEIGKVIVAVEKEELTCPKCGSNRITLKGCCGNERWKCTECSFSAPRRIFIEGLPSKRGT